MVEAMAALSWIRWAGVLLQADLAVLLVTGSKMMTKTQTVQRLYEQLETGTGVETWVDELAERTVREDQGTGNANWE